MTTIEEKPFAITNIKRIKKIINSGVRLTTIIKKIVGRDFKRDCRWGSCYYASTQDTYEFLMYLYNNVPACHKDPFLYISKCAKMIELTEINDNPYLTILLNIIRYSCSLCKTDSDLSESLNYFGTIRSIDDAFERLKKMSYSLEHAVHVVFDGIYPRHNILCAGDDTALKCWVLVIKGHVKNDNAFIGFRS